jgi:hypothetical protein
MMSTATRPSSIHVAGLMLLFAGFATAARGQTVEQRELSNDRVRILIQLLDSNDYTARTRAELELSQAGLSNISMIEAAARRDPENAARLIGVLERLFVGGADANHGKQWARSACNPTADVLLSILRVGDFGVSETSSAAEASLERLAAQNSVVAGYADAALNRHRVLRENRAIQELRRLGAKVVFNPDAELTEFELAELMDEPEERPTDRLSPPPVHGIAWVYILDEWKGGSQGLKLLSRLRVEHLPMFSVYLIEGCGVTIDDVREQVQNVPGLQTVVRSAAALGFSSSSRDESRCVISGLVEGLAAQTAGLALGDEIVAIDGRPIDRSFYKLTEYLKDYHKGDVIPVMVLRTVGPFREIEEIDVTLSGWTDHPDFVPRIFGS